MQTLVPSIKKADLGNMCTPWESKTLRFGSVTGLSVLALKTHTRNTMTSESGRNLGQEKKVLFCKSPSTPQRPKRQKIKNLREEKKIEWKHFTLQREHRADSEDKQMFRKL